MNCVQIFLDHSVYYKCDVADEISMSVEPSGELHRGMTIIIRCTIRYGGPMVIDPPQDPTIELTLDDESAFPQGELYYESPSDGTNYHIKRRVMIFYTDFEASCILSCI